MIFHFTKMDVFIAPEKTDGYRVIFKFHVLKLVISFLTLLHCLVSMRCGLGTREGSGHGRERPVPALGCSLVSAPSLSRPQRRPLLTNSLGADNLPQYS